MKLQFSSIIFALILLCIVEVTLNIYRIQRISEWSFDGLIAVIGVCIVSAIIGITIALIKLAFTWRQLFICTGLSLIYFLCFHIIFTISFPLQPYERLFPLMYLVVYAMVLVCPFYLFTIQALLKKHIAP